MKRNEKATCENCPYFDMLPGICRVNAPTICPEAEHVYGKRWGVYPETRSDSWCGLHPDLWVYEISVGTYQPDVTDINQQENEQ